MRILDRMVIKKTDLPITGSTLHPPGRDYKIHISKQGDVEALTHWSMIRVEVLK